MTDHALDERLENHFVDEDLLHRVEAVDVVLPRIHDLDLFKLTGSDHLVNVLLRQLLDFQEHFWIHGSKLLVEAKVADVKFRKAIAQMLEIYVLLLLDLFNEYLAQVLQSYLVVLVVEEIAVERSQFLEQ